MLRFADGLTIQYFVYELVPIMLNASAWSNRTAVEVTVIAIDNTQECAVSNHGFGLAVFIDTAPSVPELRDKLRAYLEKTLPAKFHVLLEHNHIEVHWVFNRKQIT